jgi:hypothetical protein
VRRSRVGGCLACCRDVAVARIYNRTIVLRRHDPEARYTEGSINTSAILSQSQRSLWAIIMIVPQVLIERRTAPPAHTSGHLGDMGAACAEKRHHLVVDAVRCLIMRLEQFEGDIITLTAARALSVRAVGADGRGAGSSRVARRRRAFRHWWQPTARRALRYASCPPDPDFRLHA